MRLRQAEHTRDSGQSTFSDQSAKTAAMGTPNPLIVRVTLAPSIDVIYTTRLGGVSSGQFATCNLGARAGDDPHAVESNRNALAQSIGAELSLVTQVHSANVFDLDESIDPNHNVGSDRMVGLRSSYRLEADGQVTTLEGVALGMFAADCLPVMLADPSARVIGAAHCGRRGLQRGVLAQTIALMCAKGARPENIVATLGPGICGDCYEVGDRVSSDFAQDFPGTATVTRFGGAGINIAAAAERELTAEGIVTEHILDSTPSVDEVTRRQVIDSPELAALVRSDDVPDAVSFGLESARHSMCTLENPLWYSHRRSYLAGHVQEGRMLALIVMHACAPDSTFG